MAARSVVIFVITLVLLRISGRRSFGLRTPLDNIISIILGAVLSRAIVGASPFISVVVSGLALALIHRGIGWLLVKNDLLARKVEGARMLLFADGKFDERKWKRALISKELVMQGVRKTALTENLDKIDKIYGKKRRDHRD